MYIPAHSNDICPVDRNDLYIADMIKLLSVYDTFCILGHYLTSCLFVYFDELLNRDKKTSSFILA